VNHQIVVFVVSLLRGVGSYDKFRIEYLGIGSVLHTIRERYEVRSRVGRVRRLMRGRGGRGIV